MNFVAAPRPLQTEECPAVVPALELLLELLSPRARSQPALRGGGLVAPASASSGHGSRPRRSCLGWRTSSNTQTLRSK